MAGKSDDTVLLRPRRRRWWWPTLVLAALVLAGSVAAGLYLYPTPPKIALPTPPPGEVFTTADEATILANVASVLTVFRFAARPDIIVLDFPDLAQQGRMLNRVAAWAEKAGQPRDHLLDEAALGAAIRASGTTEAEYYFGHDYRSADLLRFFELADRDAVALRPEEQRLRSLMTNARAQPAGLGALISLPRADPSYGVTPATRAAILHHELSHGEYFTVPVYAAFVQSFWTATMTAAERDAFRRVLAADDYDPTMEDLMINEMQAYLMHTPDLAFFDPAKLGIAPSRLLALRAAFRERMPAGWLRDSTPSILPTQPAPPRPRRYFSVSTITRSAARRPPRARKASMAA